MRKTESAGFKSTRTLVTKTGESGVENSGFKIQRESVNKIEGKFRTGSERIGEGKGKGEKMEYSDWD